MFLYNVWLVANFERNRIFEFNMVFRFSGVGFRAIDGLQVFILWFRVGGSQIQIFDFQRCFLIVFFTNFGPQFKIMAPKSYKNPNNFFARIQKKNRFRFTEVEDLELQLFPANLQMEG